MQSFNVVTWNVNGLNDRIKRTAVLQFLKRHRPFVALLQETHLLGNKCPFLARFGFNRVFHSRNTRGSRETAILLHRAFPLVVAKVSPDARGCYVVVEGSLNGRHVNFVSVYVPPMMSKVTFADLTDLLSALLQGLTFVGGDYNDVVSPDMDYLGAPGLRPRQVGRP